MFMSRRRLPAACSQRVWISEGFRSFGITGDLEQVVETFLQLLGRQGFQAQAAANAAGDGQEVGLFQAGGQAMIAGQNDGQDGAGVQVDAGQQAQFGQDQGVHFLGFVDEQHRPIERGLDVMRATFPAGLWQLAQRLLGERTTPNRWPSSR